MFMIRLADLYLQIDNKYPYVERQCKDYLCEVYDKIPDIVISVKKEDIIKELSESKKEQVEGYCESICIYREIAYRLLSFDAFVLHASVIEVDGEAYAFAAGSGTGKSTHVGLWKKYFGDRARIINGDKPIIRYINSEGFYAYGTPWCGKEKEGCNGWAPLKSICFLERGNAERIVRADEKEIVKRLFHQVLLPEEEENLTKFLDLINNMINMTPFYVLECTISMEAVGISYSCMSQ